MATEARWSSKTIWEAIEPRLARIDGEQVLRGLKWVSAFWICVIGLAARHWLNGDYISYLDVGEAWLRGDWDNAANGYWNPVFPIVAALACSLFPNHEWDGVAGHLLLIVLHLGVLWCFVWLLRQMNEFITGRSRPMSVELPLLCFPVFLVCDVIFINLRTMTADPLMGMSLFIASGIVFRIVNRGGTLRRFVFLGIVLGVGYLTKSVMLHLSLVLLLCASIFCGSSLRQTVYTSVALIIFALINTPHVALVSKKMGRFDYGDSGPLAYAWYVNNVSELFHWTGDPPGSGTPKHAPNKILSDPEVFEFTSHPYGIYPPWADPAYWNDGLKPHVNWRDQKRRIVISAHDTFIILLEPTLTLSLLACVAMAFNMIPGDFLKNLRQTMPLLATGLAGIILYFLVLVSWRYYAYLLVLIFLSLIAATLKTAAGRKTSVSVVLSLAALFFAMAVCARETYSVSSGKAQQIFRDYYKVAAVLKEHGLKKGDRIAVFGVAVDAAYARMLGLQIIAEGCTYHGSNEWLMDPAQRQRAVDATLRVGVRAIVMEAAPANLKRDTNTWVLVPDADFSILFASSGKRAE